MIFFFSKTIYISVKVKHSIIDLPSLSSSISIQSSSLWPSFPLEANLYEKQEGEKNDHLDSVHEGFFCSQPTSSVYPSALFYLEGAAFLLRGHWYFLYR